MSRKNKIGLDYFSHDTDMSNDIKVKFIQAKHGIIGYAIYNKLLELIYRDFGYYIKADERFLILFSDENKIEFEICNKIISDCLKESLFSEKLYTKYKVLTSKRIQENYLRVTEKRKIIELRKNIILVDINNVNIKDYKVDIILIDDVINEIDSVRSTHSKVKKSKEKKRDTLERINDVINFDLILQHWNLFAEKFDIPKIVSISEKRKIKILKRRDETEFNFKKIIDEIVNSDFLLGKVNTFKVTFDWIFDSKNNYLKIIEGNYRNGKQSSNNTTKNGFNASQSNQGIFS